MAHKVGDTVTVTRGPHKGAPHKVIHVHKDGSVNVKPHKMMPHQIKYRLGAAKAKSSEVRKMNEKKEDTMLQFEAWMVDTGWKKPSKVRKDKFGNIVKDKNVAKNLARKAMKKTKDDEKKEGTIITPKGFKLKDNDKEKLMKIQKMLKRDRSVAKKSTHPGPNEDVDEACWDSHKQVGYKMKGGRRVPNCVPKNENQKAALMKKLAKSAQSSEKGKKAVTLKKAPFKIPSKDDMKEAKVNEAIPLIPAAAAAARIAAPYVAKGIAKVAPKVGKAVKNVTKTVAKNPVKSTAVGGAAALSTKTGQQAAKSAAGSLAKKALGSNAGKIALGVGAAYAAKKGIDHMRKNKEREDERQKPRTRTNEVLDKDKDHMSYRQKAKYSMDRARNSATAKIVRGNDNVDKEKNTLRKRAAGMAMSDRKGVRQFRKFHGYDKKK